MNGLFCRKNGLMLNTLSIIASVLLLGWLAAKLGILKLQVEKSLDDFVYHIALPAMIISKLMKIDFNLSYAGFILANALPALVVILFSFFAYKLRLWDSRWASFVLLNFSNGNLIYLGFPVISGLYGEHNLYLGALLLGVQIPIIFGLGLTLMQRMLQARDSGSTLSRLANNRILLSTLIGIALSLLHAEVPEIVGTVLAQLGSTSIPLSLFAMGMFMHGKKLIKSHSETALLIMGKLLVFPALALLCVVIFGVKGMPGKITLVEALMPMAMTNFVIARQFGLDEELVTAAIIISTILSAPLLIGFAGIQELLIPV